MITVDSFSQNGKSYTVTIRYTLWDNFGLDDDDFDFGPRFAGGEGFDAWYVLQHYDKYDGKYKPFESVFEFTETVTGVIK